MFFNRPQLTPQPCTLHGATLDGVEGLPVEVQAISRGTFRDHVEWSKAVKVVGMPPAEATSMLIRVGGALATLGVPTTYQKLTLNLSPSGSGEALDLPIAVALLIAAGVLKDHAGFSGSLLIGSLDVHGQLRDTQGALSLCFAAQVGQTVVCPEANVYQCLLAKVTRNCRVRPSDTLNDVVQHFNAKWVLPEEMGGPIQMQPVQSNHVDFADIIGQTKLKRALEIAAAGGHGLITQGPPGTGKTMAASALAGILPPMTNGEKVELTKIWSAAGLLNDNQAVTRRPFRVVHHSASKQSLVGGGSASLCIGEVTLAHRGVLFLDEVPEFSKAVLESLRQPMEDGVVRISRTTHKTELPCRFSLVAAMNPCPCGYAPNCSCTTKQIERYQGKLSGPLMDRIDLKVESEPSSMSNHTRGESSERVRARVANAAQHQEDRLRGTGWTRNSDVPGPSVIRTGWFPPRTVTLWEQRCQSEGKSMRSAHRIAKVARTIADLAGSREVETNHMNEAFSFS